MEELRTAVIGVGNMGTAHARCLFDGRIQGMRLTALCDIREDRRTFCRMLFSGIRIFSDWHELLAAGNIDAVIIAVPHPLHAQIASEALQRGLHVLLEKPVDISVSAARKLNETAGRCPGVFAIMFNQRTNPLFRRAREIVSSGELGELKRTVWIVTNWYRTQHYYDSGDWRATWSGEGGGVLLNQAPHNLDLWQWICGMPASVTAFCDTARFHRIAVEDDATIITRYANGAVGTFITSTGEYPGTNRLEIAGDGGKLVLEEGVLKYWRLAHSERTICFSSDESFPQIETAYTEIHQDKPESGHAGILQNFANAALHGETLISPGTDGINELTLSNAAYLSEWMGNCCINLPLDETAFDTLLAQKAAEEQKKSSDDKSTDSGQAGYASRWQVRW